MVRKALFILLFSINSWGACDKPVSAINEGEPAKCTGFLFTPEKELDVRLKISSYELTQALLKKQEDIIAVQDQRLNNNQQQIMNLEKQIGNKDIWNQTLYFTLGAVITAVIANNVGR